MTRNTNEDDTLGFDAFPPPHIALINIHLCVSAGGQRRACTASYTPSPIDPAIRWRREEEKKTKHRSKEAESRIAERMREKVASQVQCEEKRETERHKKKKKIDEIKKKVGKSF